MSNNKNNEASINIIKAVDDNAIKTPNMPVDKFVQEAEDLYKWCQEDKELLVAADLDWKLVKDMPARARALRQAESLWYLYRYKREEARNEWIERCVRFVGATISSWQ